MNRHVRQVAYFLSSQHFSNGFRTTLSILLPSLLMAQFGQLPTGMALSLGALAVSLSDAPGPVRHRRNAMLATVLVSTVMTIITGFARQNPITMALTIGVFGFFFSMFVVYGNRATAVGTAALLTLVLMLDRPLDGPGIWRESGLIAVGGLWYTTVSLLSSQLRPYQAARQALGQCIHEMAKFMNIKADFYDVRTPLDEDYRRLVAQQVVVSEKQDAVREILFKSRQVMASSDNVSRLLIVTFTDVVDLYEQIVAMYYDYSVILERFGESDVLKTISRLIRRMAAELDSVGLSIQAPLRPHQPLDLGHSLEALKRDIDALSATHGSTLVLKKVLVSLRLTSQRLAMLQSNLTQPNGAGEPDVIEYGRFVSHQAITLQLLRDNLTRQSSAFRHSVRVAVALLVGFLLTIVLPYGHYSYWMLLTILVIMKPAFSLTKQRNIERITGTFFGGLAGILILMVVPDKTGQFVFLVLFMIGTYSTQRTNYRAMVLCLTPFVIILFNLLGVGYLSLVEERLIDTVIGGLLAMGASYLLFPNWESNQIVNQIRELLTANVRYLSLLADALAGQSIQVVDYKLARKDVYVSSANLSAAFERMSSEPKRTQRNAALIYEFVVLNHILSANIATITSSLLGVDPLTYPPAAIRSVKRALAILTASLHQLGAKAPESAGHPHPAAEPPAPADGSLNEHLAFIQQVSSDIANVVTKGNWRS